ncbi:MAG: hypothetical protein GPJ54_00870 [Candidatus Heimdallarchaeota archaeon]|nr:hypothetical protein [Candidatus Heimdallarchaeota archaeon]
MSVLSVRIEEELEKKLNKILKLKNIQDKSAYIRQVLNQSLQEDLVDYYCNEVSEKRISIQKSAKIVGISLRAMLHELAKRNIPMYDEEALQDDLEFLRG